MCVYMNVCAYTAVSTPTVVGGQGSFSGISLKLICTLFLRKFLTLEFSGLEGSACSSSDLLVSALQISRSGITGLYWQTSFCIVG